jgi:hypothetical protein
VKFINEWIEANRSPNLDRPKIFWSSTDRA